MGQTAWGWLVVVYLFLGGLGAGAFLTAAFFELSGWRYKRDFCPTVLTGATISGPVVALGSVLLIFDLGAGRMEPWRIVYLFTNFSSVMTWGIWILCLFIPVALFYGLLELVEVETFAKGFIWARFPRLLRNLRPTRRWVAIVGSVLAVGVAIYTGVLISTVGPAVPFWSLDILPFLPIPMMPVLFLVSALSTGMALTFDLSATIAAPHIHEQMGPMALVHIILIGLENILIGMLLIMALSEGGAAADSAQMIMYGPLRITFWVGVVLIGLVYPFVVHAYAIGAGRHSLWSGIGSGVGIVLAGLFLRYLIVIAGIPAYIL
jgi:formate-dependent nitrite reductase membrane component NrfD